MTDTGPASSGEPAHAAGTTTAAPDTAGDPAFAHSPSSLSPSSTAPSSTPPSSTPPPRRRGVSGTVADMARSLGVLVVLIAVVWFVSGMWHNSTHRAAGIADWRSEVTQIAPTASFVLQAPGTLPAGWSVSALQLSGSGISGDWTMSVTTPTGHYLDLDQAPGTVAERVGAVLPAAVAAGQVRLTAGAWSRYGLPADAQGRAEMALAHEVAGTAVVISGSGTLAEQSRLADSLRATR
jgi:hypothetical protein